MTNIDEAKKLRKELHRLTDFVKDYLVLLDATMKELSSEGRGRRIGELAGKLHFKNDSVRRFVLELDFNGKPLKRAKVGK